MRSMQSRSKANERHVHHVNVTVPKSLEDAAKHFYGVVMGLQEVPKPETSRGRGGAWYQLGRCSFIYRSKTVGRIASASDTFVTRLLILPKLKNDFGAQASRSCPTISDPGWSRFYVRDPGGNRLEIAQGSTVT